MGRRPGLSLVLSLFKTRESHLASLCLYPFCPKVEAVLALLPASSLWATHEGLGGGVTSGLRYRVSPVFLLRLGPPASALATPQVAPGTPPESAPVEEVTEAEQIRQTYWGQASLE